MQPVRRRSSVEENLAKAKARRAKREQRKLKRGMTGGDLVRLGISKRKKARLKPSPAKPSPAQPSRADAAPTTTTRF